MKILVFILIFLLSVNIVSATLNSSNYQVWRNDNGNSGYYPIASISGASPIWSYNLGIKNSGFIIHNYDIYVNGYNSTSGIGSLLKLDLNGNLIGNFTYDFKSNGSITYYNGTIYTIDSQGTLYGINSENLTLLIKRQEHKVVLFIL